MHSSTNSNLPYNSLALKLLDKIRQAFYFGVKFSLGSIPAKRVIPDKDTCASKKPQKSGTKGSSLLAADV